MTLATQAPMMFRVRWKAHIRRSAEDSDGERALDVAGASAVIDRRLRARIYAVARHGWVHPPRRYLVGQGVLANCAIRVPNDVVSEVIDGVW
jgi:hypothetical protein